MKKSLTIFTICLLVGNVMVKASQTKIVAWGDDGYGQTNTPASLTNVTELSAGDGFCLALQEDGSVIGWGYNLDGETNIPQNATNIIAIAAGGYHGLALTSEGNVIAWGDNGFGETNVPSNATNVIAIAGGAYHSLALRADGTVIAWGAGTNNLFPSEYAVCGQCIVPPGLTNVVAIAGGYAHSLALLANGTIVGWGRDDYGQADPPANATNVIAIAAGDIHSLALRKDGTIVAWGYNAHGEINVPANATNVIAIAACHYHSLALRADGSMIGWGAGMTNNPDDFVDYGQSIIPFNLTNVLKISAGANFSVALAVLDFPTNPPTINQSPLSRVLGTGSDTTFSLQISGDSPFSYQWRFNGSPIPRAVGSTLTLNNLNTPQVGFYDVVVTGPAGVVTSAVASVGLFDMQMVPTGAQPLPLLILNGASGATYHVEANSNLSNTNWLLLAPVTANGNPYYYVDISAQTNSAQFYRARPILP